jgi:3-methyladenine DNA glycosylase AlkD
MTEKSKLLEYLPPTPDPDTIIQALEEIFVDLGGDPDYLSGMRMTVPGAGKLYGVKVPVLRKVSRELIQRYKNERSVISKLAEACWHHGSREHQLVALFLLAGINMRTSERWSLGVRFLPQVSNWETCDQLCMALLGQALAEDPQYMDILETWLQDENLWVRRAVLVAPVYIRRAKYAPDVAQDLDRRTLVMAAQLLDDGEKYIQKAVDWTVREVLKRHYSIGLAWMRVQAALDLSKIAKSTLRLASKKLNEEDREAVLNLLNG